MGRENLNTEESVLLIQYKEVSKQSAIDIAIKNRSTRNYHLQVNHDIKREKMERCYEIKGCVLENGINLPPFQFFLNYLKTKQNIGLKK